MKTILTTICTVLLIATTFTLASAQPAHAGRWQQFDCYAQAVIDVAYASIFHREHGLTIRNQWARCAGL